MSGTTTTAPVRGNPLGIIAVALEAVALIGVVLSPVLIFALQAYGATSVVGIGQGVLHLGALVAGVAGLLVPHRGRLLAAAGAASGGVNLLLLMMSTVVAALGSALA